MSMNALTTVKNHFTSTLSDPAPQENPQAIKLLLGLSLIFSLIAAIGFLIGGYHWAFASLNKLNPSINAGLLHLITSFGDGIFLLSLILLIAHKKPKFLAAVLIASVIGGIASQSLKELFDAVRPPGVLDAGDFFLTAKAYTHNSFPSGHTLTAFLAASICACFSSNKGLIALYLTLATLVGLSRVIIGVHWPIDALIGAALGSLSGLFAFISIRKWPALTHPGVSTFTLLVLLYAAYSALAIPNDYYLAQPFIYGAAALAIALSFYNFILKPLKDSYSVSAQPQIVFIGFLLAITAYRLFVLSMPHFELFYDEAYYYHWALNPDLGYYSKPPVVAWFIALSSGIFGDSIFGIRFFSPMLYAGSALFIFQTTKIISDSRSAAIAGIVFLSAPVIGFNSEFITTDAPLIFFWALTLYVTVQTLQSRTTAMWVILGVCCGLGMLSKYTMAALPLSIFLFFLSELKYRILLLSKGPWIAAIVAGLFFSLNLYWNSQHEWISFLHTSEISKQESSGLNFPSLFEFLAAQIFVFGPVWSIALLICIAKVKQIKIRNKALIKLFLYSAAGILIIISLQALTARAFINWAAPWIVGASIILGLAARDSSLFSRKWLVRGLIAQLILCAAFYHWPQILKQANIDLTAKNDPFHRVVGWKSLSKELDPIIENKDYILASDSRDLLAYVGFYAFPNKDKFARWNPASDNIRDHYDLKYNFRNYVGEPNVYLFISKQALNPKITERFDSVSLLAAFTHNPYPDQSLTLFVYELQGFNGYE